MGPATKTKHAAMTTTTTPDLGQPAGAATCGPWRPGLSETSAGRFGGFRGFRQPEQGFLCWSASAERILVHDEDDQRGRLIFQFLPESNVAVREQVDWTTQQFTYGSADGHRLGRVIHSLLFPGALFEWHKPTFAWWNFNFTAATVAYPSVGGYRVVGPRECNYPTFDATGPTAFAGPWMLLWMTRGDLPFPLLFLFENPPRRIETIARAQRFYFEGPAGVIAVCPLRGCDRWSGAEYAKLARGLDESTARLIHTWSRLKLAVPIGCEEHYRFDPAAGRLQVRHRFEYVRSKDAFGTPPLTLAPLPPLLAMAEQVQQSQGVDLGFRLEGQPLDPGIPTLFGPYVGVEGNEVRFSLPRSAGIEHTIAPVRVLHDPRCDELTAKLDRELAGPTMTFGGDHTYDPDNIQDICHNLRVLGWATWSLDAPRRRQRFANLARDLRGLEPGQYVLETEPVTGLTYRWQKDIWGGGAIAVDLEWYNGMQLAGLWAGLFYGEDEAGWLERVRSQWPLLLDLLRYYEIFHDWATGLTFTALTRKCLWFDGLNFAWQGQAAAARLARLVGDEAAADRAEYLAARSCLGRAVAWFMYDYAAAHRCFLPEKTAEVGVDTVHATAVRDRLTVTGFLERRGVTVGPAYHPGNAIGYLVFEQFLLQRLTPAILEKIRRGQYEFLDKDMADWPYRYCPSPDGRGPTRKHPLYPSHMHFYHLDPQLFARALLLREPLDKLLSYSAALSGPVLECFLVARAPMVIFPTSARFRGVTFDAATGELRVQWSAPSGRVLELLVADERRPSSVTGATRWRHDASSRLTHCELLGTNQPQSLILTFPPAP